MQLILSSHCLIFSCLFFSLGVVGTIINYSNLIILLVSIEFMLLGINTNFIVFSNTFGHQDGYMFVFFILTMAAAEMALGLSISINLFRRNITDISKSRVLLG